MGDVFDRIVSRVEAVPQPSAAARLTMRRAPSFAGPDRSDPETEVVGPETGPVAGAPTRPAPGALGPATPASPASLAGPPSVVRRDGRPPEPGSRGPQTAGSTGERPSGPPTPHLDRQTSDVVGPRPARSDLSSRRAAPGVGPLRPEDAPAEEAPTEAGTGAPLPPAPDGLPADAVPARPGLRVRPRPSRPDHPAPAPPARTVSSEELLREHLAPALVDRAVLSTRDGARLTAVGLDPIEVPAGGDVHVHLGRVEVVQQAPARPAPEPPRRAGGGSGHPDRVDHTDYLDRQRRRWS